jgi:putative transcriptional regulator
MVRVRQNLRLSRGALRGVPSHERAHAGELGAGRAKPNAQAALLINLVKRFPHTVDRLAAI